MSNAVLSFEASTLLHYLESERTFQRVPKVSKVCERFGITKAELREQADELIRAGEPVEMDGKTIEVWYELEDKKGLF